MSRYWNIIIIVNRNSTMVSRDVIIVARANAGPEQYYW